MHADILVIYQYTQVIMCICLRVFPICVFIQKWRTPCTPIVQNSQKTRKLALDPENSPRKLRSSTPILTSCSICRCFGGYKVKDLGHGSTSGHCPCRKKGNSVWVDLHLPGSGQRERCRVGHKNVQIASDLQSTLPVLQTWILAVCGTHMLT